MKKCKLLVSIVIVLTCISLMCPLVAMMLDLGNLPVINEFGEMVADENTRYTTVVTQNQSTKLITATVQVTNGSSTQDILVNGVGLQISFNDKVAPYAYDPLLTGFNPALLFSGKNIDDNSVFLQYCKPLLTRTDALGNVQSFFNQIGTSIIQRDASGGMLGAKLSATRTDEKLTISPGQTLSLVEFYFMPVNGTDALDINMFSYKYSYDSATQTRASTWLGNGTYFLHSSRSNIPNTSNYVAYPAAFKLHVQHAPPVVYANTETKTITGYDANTMEWSDKPLGPFSGGTPTIGNEAQTIYVRYKSDADYSGGDTLYGDYKKYLASDAVPVIFSQSAMAIPSLVKTAVNLTSTDGKTRVGDVIEYTIKASNIGSDGSIWANALLDDYLRDGVIFDEDADGGKVVSPGIWNYYPVTRRITAELGDIAKNQVKEFKFRVTVAPDAFGKDITNSVTVQGKNGTDSNADDLDKTVEEDGGKRIVEGDPGKSKQPDVDPINEGDEAITGKGEPGSDIVVELEDGTKLDGKVDEDGDWSVDVPKDKELKGGDKVKVVQKEDGKNPSDPKEVVVIGKPRVVVTFDPNQGTLAEANRTKTVVVEEPYGTLPRPTRSGYYFGGWYTQQTGGNQVWADDKVTATIDHTLYAHWAPYYDGGGDDENKNNDKDTCSVTFQSNYAPERVIATAYGVPKGGSVGEANMPTNPVRTDYTFTGWNTSMNGTGTVFTANTIVTSDISVYAQWRRNDGGDNGDDDSNVIITDTAPPLAGFLMDHVAYIFGYPDGSVRPDNAITRAEVAIIFFRLLSNEAKNMPIATMFNDVASVAWYAQAVNYLASVEILTGYADGTFRPDQRITRAEFATVVSRFDYLLPTTSNAFADVANHWAIAAINSAYAKGWVNGYPDGTFKPEQNITRAEVVTVVNTMLNRKLRIENVPGIIKRFTDFEGHWAFADIVEASNSHTYIRRNDGYETWN